MKVVGLGKNRQLSSTLWAVDPTAEVAGEAVTGERVNGSTCALRESWLSALVTVTMCFSSQAWRFPGDG